MRNRQQGRRCKRHALSVTRFDSRHLVRRAPIRRRIRPTIRIRESRADVDDVRGIPVDVGIVPQTHEVVKVTLLTRARTRAISYTGARADHTRQRKTAPR